MRPQLAFSLLMAACVVQAQFNYTLPSQNFTQKLNHGGCDDGATFQQLYQIDTRHFRPGGPILFHQSEEGPIVGLDRNMMYDYAPHVGGISCVLEHRYFGTSFPEGMSSLDNLTTAQYHHLTLENILGDGINFVTWIKRTISGAENSRVIYTGGSYGGFLATQARIRHPDVFYGALVMSPKLRGFGASRTLADNPYKYAASDHIANTFWDADAAAAEKIRAAMYALDVCIKSDTCATAFADFDLCTRPASAAEWRYLLEFLLVDRYGLIAQYNYGIKVNLPANPLNVLLNATKRATSHAEVLRLPLDLALGGPNLMALPAQKCVNWTAIGTPETRVASFGIGRAYLYLQCAWLVGSVNAVGPGNALFPPVGVDKMHVACPYPESDWASPDLHETDEFWQRKYNLTDAELDRVTRLLIVHGEYDRIGALGMPRLSGGGNRDKSRVVVGSMMAHGDSTITEWRYPRGIRPAVDHMRELQLEYIKAWAGDLGHPGAE